MSENQLVEDCLNGCRIAQQKVYAKYSPMCMSICLRYAGNMSEAEDILQESFIKVFTKMKQFNRQGPLGAWIRRVTVNSAAEFYRKQKNIRLESDLSDHGYLVGSSVDALQNLEMEELMEKIQNLPTGFRVVFNMYAIEGYSHKEIGEILEVSEGTSKSQYSRAKAALREMIINEEKLIERAV